MVRTFCGGYPHSLRELNILRAAALAWRHVEDGGNVARRIPPDANTGLQFRHIAAQRRARTVAHDSSTVRDIFSTAYLYIEPASSPRGVVWPASSAMLPARIPFARKMWMATSALVSFTISKSTSASDCVVRVGMGQGALRHGVNTSEAGGRRGKSRGSRNIATAARRAAANYTGSRPAEPTVHPYSTVSQRARDHSETGCRDVRDKKGTQ